jgi:hypothetical protein
MDEQLELVIEIASKLDPWRALQTLLFPAPTVTKIEPGSEPIIAEIEPGHIETFSSIGAARAAANPQITDDIEVYIPPPRPRGQSVTVPARGTRQAKSFLVYPGKAPLLPPQPPYRCICGARFETADQLIAHRHPLRSERASGMPY